MQAQTGENQSTLNIEEIDSNLSFSELVVKNRTCSLKDTDAIGKPKEVVIKHSNSDRVWLLDYVCIKSNQYGRQLFPFNDWFDQYSVSFLLKLFNGIRFVMVQKRSRERQRWSE